MTPVRSHQPTLQSAASSHNPACYVYVIEDQILTSPCDIAPPAIARESLTTEEPDPCRIHLTHFSNNRYPTLAWVPTNPYFLSKPLSVLRVDVEQVGIQRVGNRYILDKNMVKAWATLENNLHFISEALLKETNYRLPLDTVDFPAPTRYGYQRSHSFRQGAKMAAKKSLHAFGPLIGWVSYLFAQHLGKSPSGAIRWEFLLSNAGVPGDSITDLRESELLIFTPSYRRAGVIITQDCQFKWLAQSMLRNGVPFWVLWDSHTAPEEMASLNLFKPTPEAIERARSVALISKTSGPKEKPWESFFRLRERLKPNLIANETAVERNKRLQREREAQTHPLPEKQSTAKVFYWDAADQPERVRRLLTRLEAQQTWGSYSNRQRVYNGFTNEWDICSEFGDASSDDDDDEQGHLQSHTAGEHNGHKWHDTLAAEYDHPVVTTSHTFDRAFTDCLYQCYGFLNPPNTTVTATSNPEYEWQYILKCFGYPSVGNTPETLRGPISCFLDQLIQHTTVSGSLCDIGDNCGKPLENCIDDAAFRLRIVRDEHNCRYVLSSRDSSTTFGFLEIATGKITH